MPSKVCLNLTTQSTGKSAVQQASRGPETDQRARSSSFFAILASNLPGKCADQVYRGQLAITLESDLAAHNLVRKSLAWPQWKYVEYQGTGEELSNGVVS